MVIDSILPAAKKARQPEPPCFFVRTLAQLLMKVGYDTALFVFLQFLEEREIILPLFVGKSDSGTGVLVEIAGQQILDVIAPYHAVIDELLHIVL